MSQTDLADENASILPDSSHSAPGGEDEEGVRGKGVELPEVSPY